MIQLKNDKLIIEIKTPSPDEDLPKIRKALIAAIRWHASSESLYTTDDCNLHAIAQLLEELE